MENSIENGRVYETHFTKEVRRFEVNYLGMKISGNLEKEIERHNEIFSKAEYFVRINVIDDLPIANHTVEISVMESEILKFFMQSENLELISNI